MSGIERYQALIEEIDFVLAEQRVLRQQGVHLIVEHLDHEPGTTCAPGEMIGDIQLAGLTPRSFGVPHTSLLLLDCLCRYRQPLSADRIEQIMRTDPFYVHYAANRTGRNQCFARPDRRSVRSCVSRIRQQMATLFAQIALDLDSRAVLVAEATDAKRVVYRLKATVSVVNVSKRQ